MKMNKAKVHEEQSKTQQSNKTIKQNKDTDVKETTTNLY